MGIKDRRRKRENARKVFIKSVGGKTMEVIKAIKIDEEERNTLKNAMLIIEEMRNKTDDPLLEKLMKDFEPLAKCLNNGSVWM